MRFHLSELSDSVYFLAFFKIVIVAALLNRPASHHLFTFKIIILRSLDEVSRIKLAKILLFVGCLAHSVSMDENKWALFVARF